MAIIRARRSVFGDDIADALAGSDSDALLTPGFATSSPAPAPGSTPQASGLIPISSSGPGAPGGSGQSWTGVFQNVVSSLFGTGRAPGTLVNRAPAPTSSTDTVLVVGGLAAFGLVAYMLMRRD